MYFQPYILVKSRPELVIRISIWRAWVIVVHFVNWISAAAFAVYTRDHPKEIFPNKEIWPHWKWPLFKVDSIGIGSFSYGSIGIVGQLFSIFPTCRFCFLCQYFRCQNVFLTRDDIQLLHRIVCQSKVGILLEISSRGFRWLRQLRGSIPHPE